MSLLWLQNNKIVEESHICLGKECPCDDEDLEICVCTACSRCMTVVPIVYLDGIKYYSILTLPYTDYCKPFSVKNLEETSYLYDYNTRLRTNITINFSILVLSKMFIIHNIAVTEVVDPFTSITYFAPDTKIEGNGESNCEAWGTVWRYTPLNYIYGMMGDKFSSATLNLYSTPELVGTYNITFDCWFGGPADDSGNEYFGEDLLFSADGRTVVATKDTAVRWYANFGTYYYYLMMDTSLIYNPTSYPVRETIGSYSIFYNGISDFQANIDGHCGGPVGRYTGRFKTFEVSE